MKWLIVNFITGLLQVGWVFFSLLIIKSPLVSYSFTIPDRIFLYVYIAFCVFQGFFLAKATEGKA